MSTYKEVAIAAAQEAGKVLLKLSQQDIKYELKSSHDILAEGDLKSESVIMEKIKAAFPSHSILSEEAGEEVHDVDFLWVIDPIDGTINFSRHIDEYCISIALVEKSEIVLSVIYRPTLNRLYVAEKGKGAFLNGEQLHVSSEPELINCIAAADNSSRIDIRTKTFEILTQLSAEVRHIRIFGSGALHLARLAEGQIDVYFKPRFNYWDYAAGVLLVKEACGTVTDFAGNDITRDSKEIIATNGLLHEHAIKFVR